MLITAMNVQGEKDEKEERRRRRKDLAKKVGGTDR